MQRSGSTFPTSTPPQLSSQPLARPPATGSVEVVEGLGVKGRAVLGFLQATKFWRANRSLKPTEPPDDESSTKFAE